MAKIGYVVPETKDFRAFFTPANALFFLDDASLVVTYLVRNPEAGMSTAGKPGGKFLLATALLDLKSGDTVAKKVWGNAKDSFDIAPVSGSRMAIVDQQGVALVDRAFHEIDRVPHPPDNVASEGPGHVVYSSWSLRTSASGKTIAVIHSGGYLASIGVFDSANLTELARVKQAPFFVRAITDDRFLSVSAARDTDNLALRAFKYPSDPVAIRSVDNCFQPKFLGNGSIICSGQNSHRLQLISGFDQPIKSVDLGLLFALSPEIARSNDRFIVDLVKIKPRNTWLDNAEVITTVRTVLYDPDLHELRTLPSALPVAKFLGRHSISPSGHWVAFLADSQLYWYSITTD